MTDERDARDQLVKNWSRYPALAKEQCVKPQEYLSGYVEWLVCIEMTRDAARRARSSRALPPQGWAPAAVPRLDEPIRRAHSAPFVKYADDGSIDYVVNC